MTRNLDPITVSVVSHRLTAIVEEMGEAMLRTAYSQILNSSRDFSAAICDRDCRLVAQAEHIPVHVGAMPWAAKAVSARFGEDVHEGDLFVVNDPYAGGGSHLPDVTVFAPVFIGGRLAFWTINRAHHSDIGGATHGAYNPSATEIFHEGLRIPPLRLWERGRPREDLLEMLALNVRHPRDFKGDLAAQNRFGAPGRSAAPGSGRYVRCENGHGCLRSGSGRGRAPVARRSRKLEGGCVPRRGVSRRRWPRSP